MRRICCSWIMGTYSYIPPTGWKSERCDLTTILWLNLTDRSILYYDYALNYYRESSYPLARDPIASLPLAVKLGSITSQGEGEVYSYQEDDSNLKPIAGPGLTGMWNLGNSCYLNMIQVMFTVPDFVRRFEEVAEIFDSYPADPANDFNVQMSKLGVSLCSCKYSVLTDNSMDTVDSSFGIAPTMFNLDFTTKHQQDTREFFLHLVNTLKKHSRNQAYPTNALKFSIENRVEC